LSIIRQKSSVIHPLLFAFFPIISLFSNNVSELPPEDILLPSLILVTIALVAWYVLGMFSKNYFKTGLVISTFLFLFFSYGHFHFLLPGLLNAFDEISHKIPLLFFLALFIIITIFIIKSKRKFDNLTKIVNIVAIVIISFSLVNVTSFYLSNITSFENELSPTQINFINATSSFPNIYYIILDGYGRSDSLLKYYKFDNSDFLTSLKNKGFYIPEKATSNYPSTRLSLPSSLDMRYVNDILPQSGNPNWHKFFQTIDQNNAMQFLKTRGYEIYNIGSGWEPTQNIQLADHTLCKKGISVNSELVIQIFHNSMMKPIYAEFFGKGQEQQILCHFSTLKEINKIANEPYFVFSHIISPHPPYLFGPNGESVSPESLLLNDPESHKDIDSFVGQLQFVNKEILKVVESIQNNEDRPTIIIIQADHGTNYSIDENNITDDTILERLSILNAYYFSDKNYTTINEDITPVNTFRTIFNLYLDGNFEILEKKHYFFTKTDGQYKMWDVTDIIN